MTNWRSVLGALAAVSLIATLFLPPQARRTGWFVTGALVVLMVLVSLARNIAFLAGDQVR
jgi:hypothetical protein